MAKSAVVNVALVTGGARGIGRSIAATLASKGMGVMVADLLDTSECVEQIRASGGRAMGVRADMADPSAAKQAVLQTVEVFGRLNVLINNAGMHPQGREWPPLREMELEFWERIIRANLMSTVVWTQEDGGTMRVQVANDAHPLRCRRQRRCGYCHSTLPRNRQVATR